VLGDYQRIFNPEKHQRFTQVLSVAYLDIVVLCTEFKNLLRNQKKSGVKRIFQPLSPALNSRLDEAVLRFRQHRKGVDKEAELCHMIEEKEARDLVVRNHAAAEARERGEDEPKSSMTFFPDRSQRRGKTLYYPLWLRRTTQLNTGECKKFDTKVPGHGSRCQRNSRPGRLVLPLQ
jgi:hypothetical protein